MFRAETARAVAGVTGLPPSTARLGRELNAVRAEVDMLAARLRRIERRTGRKGMLDAAIAFLAGALAGGLVVAALFLIGRI